LAPAQNALQQTARRFPDKAEEVKIFGCRKKSNKEVLDNLDRIVKINEYKEIQKLLDPISLVISF
jgi:histidyl-tRNA synthetase